MSDAPFMIGANGLIVDTSFNGMPPGYATVGVQPNIAPGESPNLGDAPTPGPWVATRLLPGAIVQLRGAGQYNLPTGAASPLQGIGAPGAPVLGGVRGSMQIDFVGAGNTTGIQTLALLAGATPASQILGSFVAAGALGLVVLDATGAVVISASSGVSLTGVHTVRIFWDSAAGSAQLYLDGTLIFAHTGSWTPFAPTSVLYGNVTLTANAPGSLVPFLGTLLKVQVSNSAAVVL